MFEESLQELNSVYLLSTSQVLDAMGKIIKIYSESAVYLSAYFPRTTSVFLDFLMVVGKIMPSQPTPRHAHAHSLIPGTCEHVTSHSKRDFVDGIALR